MSGTEEYLRIAKITGVHGLHGRLKIFVISDLNERFEPGNRVFIPVGVSFEEYRIRSFHHQKARSALLEIEGVNGVDEALELKNRELFIPRDEAEKFRSVLDGNTFYYYDIIGCTVYRDGSVFGTVTDIFEAGAGDILVIRESDGKEVLIPFIDEMVHTEELGQGKITITPVDGLID